MPPQQPEGLLDLVEDGRDFGTHGVTGPGNKSKAGCSEPVGITQALCVARIARGAIRGGPQYPAVASPLPLCKQSRSPDGAKRNPGTRYPILLNL
jgi:hypothetical protein